MYQMTTFFKKVIYKKNYYLINTHQKKSNCTIFSNFLGGACPKTPLAECMASLSCGYVQRIALTHANLHFRKKILTPYQILYTLLAYMYKLIKDILTINFKIATLY